MMMMMKKLPIRRLSRVADSSVQYEPRKAPEGHVPVYVGEEMERFAVRIELLGHPMFLELLRRSAQEYGYRQQGVLRIPCPVPLFERILGLLAESGDRQQQVSADEVEAEMLRFFNNGS